MYVSRISEKTPNLLSVWLWVSHLTIWACFLVYKKEIIFPLSHLIGFYSKDWSFMVSKEWCVYKMMLFMELVIFCRIYLLPKGFLFSVMETLHYSGKRLGIFLSCIKGLWVISFSFVYPHLLLLSQWIGLHYVYDSI